MSSNALKRFNELSKELENNLGKPYFSWFKADKVWMTLQDRFFNKSGKRFLNLYEVMLDNKLSQMDKEWVLLELAKEIATLHSNQREEFQLHGFIHPCNIYISFDEKERPSDVILADAGVYTSIGPQNFLRHFHDIIQGTLTLDESLKNYANAIYLSPEQQDPSSFSLVNYRSDIYLFALIAYYVFIKDNYSPSADVDWEKLPLSWRGFIKRALEKDPLKRPEDFEELLVLLKQPELELVFSNKSLKSKGMTDAIDQLVNLKDVFSKVNIEKEGAEVKGEIKQTFDYAKKLFNMSKWDLAKREYEALNEKFPKNALVLTNLAIASFELKEYDLARDYYTQSKEISPQEARRYREHILS
ncbi:hypothetical protein AB751O23_AH_00120 [Chlamydiales bacterium SCGC AB-751-O23]|nr:hypothetical protein AB751O23_AH_00120 [Chlamydiales bacterium SCGC AB-751-O23]